MPLLGDPLGDDEEEGYLGDVEEAEEEEEEEDGEGEGEGEGGSPWRVFSETLGEERIPGSLRVGSMDCPSSAFVYLAMDARMCILRIIVIMIIL